MTEMPESSHHEVGPACDPRSRVEVLFEFSVPKPKFTLYRALRTIDGGYRVEKRGPNAKLFRAVMWCGSEESLLTFRQAIESHFGNKGR